MKTKLLMISTVMVFMLYATGCGKDDEPDNRFYWVPKNPPSFSTQLPQTIEAVDLGLCVLWATCNFGATKAEEYGGYFAWGDPTGALWSIEGIEYDSGGYIWETDNYGGKTPKMEISGTSRDVVTQHWGNGWRTPSLEDAAELCNQCEWKLMNDNGRKFYRVTGPNGNSIDLPLAGAYADVVNSTQKNHGDTPCHQNEIGYYWTATVANLGVADTGSSYKIHSDVYRSFAFVCNSYIGDLTGLPKFMIHLRAFHMSIRPVKSK